MHLFVPEFVVENAKENNHSGLFEVSVLSVELNGLDRLLHDLLERSDTKAEDIFAVQNYIFTPVIEAIKNHGGFVVSLCSLLFSAMFPDSNRIGAINAVVSIRDFFDRSGNSINEFGDYAVSADIFLVRGEIEWFALPTKDDSIYWFSGPVFGKICEARRNRQSQQIVMENGLLDSAGLQKKSINRDFCILENANLLEGSEDKGLNMLIRSKFMHNGTRQLNEKGNLREKLCFYINLDELIEEHINTIIDSCAEHGGILSRIDSVDKGWVALILFDRVENNDKKTARLVHLALQLLALGRTNIRIGLTSGKIYCGIIGSNEYSYLTTEGIPINSAFKLMQKSEWGEIWCDGSIRKCLVELPESVCSIQLQSEDISEDIETWRVYPRDESQEFSHYLTDFIGRTDELEKLERSCNPLWKGENAGVIYIYGDIGYGKSRLVHQFKQILGNRVEYFSLTTDSGQQTLLNPFTNWVKTLFTSRMVSSSSESLKDFRSQWIEFKQEIAEVTDAKQIKKELDRIESILAGMIGLEWEGSVYSSLEPKYRATVKGFALKSLLEILSLIKPVVLVIENLQWLDKESEEILQILTRRTTTMPCKVILTSRMHDNRDYPHLNLDSDVQEERIYLNGLNKSHVKQLIESILQKKVSDDIANYIYSLSNGNPLLIEQMTQYLEKTGKLEIQNDCFYLKEQSFELPKGLISAIIARLNRLGPELKKTVQIASVLGSEFSVQILYKILETQDSKPDFLNASIVRTQLLLVEHEHIWHAIDEARYVFNHPLLCEIIYKMQSKQQLKKLHLLAARILQENYSDYKLMLTKIAEHFEKAGEWEQAIDYYKRAGDYYNERYNFSQAITNYNQALIIKTRIPGEINLDIAELYCSIGTVYCLKGECDKALDYYQQALGLRKELLSPQSPEVAHVYKEIGNAYIKQSDHNQGEQYTLMALELYQAITTEHQTEIADCLYNLGAVYKMKNEFSVALKYFRRVYKLIIEHLGERHINTAKNLSALGVIYADLGDFDRAVSYNKRAITVYESTVGRRHPHVATTLYNLGINHIFKGEQHKALDYLDQALSIQRDVFGERHSETADTIYVISVVYSRLGDHEAALSYLKEALSINREIFGDQHPNTAILLNSIGSMYIRKGDFDRALEYIQKALTIDQRTLGERHPQTSYDLTNMGIIYGNKGNQEKALHCIEQAISIQKEIFGEKDSRTGHTMTFLAEIYIDKGEIERALEYVLQSLAISNETLGERHPKTAVSLHLLGDIYIEKGENDKALSYLEQAFDISNELVGPDQVQTAQSLNSIGQVHLHKGDFNKAITFIEKALAIFKDKVLSSHPGMIECLRNLGKVYCSQKDYEKALEYFKQVFSLRRESLGDKHKWAIDAINDIINTCEKAGKVEEAEEYRKMIILHQEG